MSGREVWRTAALAGLLATAAACGTGTDAATDDPVIAAAASAAAETTTSDAPTTTTSTSTAPTTTAAPTTTTTTHPERVVDPQAFVPYATVGPVTLHHPSDRVEAIGFHQSGHDGAQPQVAASSAVRSFTMESRDRDTIPQGAADIVVEPDRALRVPVTGTVIRAGTYTLYCDHVDQYAVIEPDAHPGWEVKVLHIDGLALSVGQRVEAGVTPLAARSRVLPFESQVEESTGLPAWPHVHVEVVDPNVPDRATGGGCP